MIVSCWVLDAEHKFGDDVGVSWFTSRRKKNEKGKNGNSESALQNKYYEPFYQKITRDTLHYNFEWSIHKNTFFSESNLTI